MRQCHNPRTGKRSMVRSTCDRIRGGSIIEEIPAESHRRRRDVRERDLVRAVRTGGELETFPGEARGKRGVFRFPYGQRRVRQLSGVARRNHERGERQRRYGKCAPQL